MLIEQDSMDKALHGLKEYGHLHNLTMHCLNTPIPIYEGVGVFKGLLSASLALIWHIDQGRFFAIECTTILPLLKPETKDEVQHTAFPSLYKVGRLHSSGFYKVLAQDAQSKDAVRHLCLQIDEKSVWYPIEQIHATL
jgi:hypothetical protein